MSKMDIVSPRGFIELVLKIAQCSGWLVRLLALATNPRYDMRAVVRFRRRGIVVVMSRPISQSLDVLPIRRPSL